jgi:hypothetical protein
VLAENVVGSFALLLIGIFLLVFLLLFLREIDVSFFTTCGLLLVSIKHLCIDFIVGR